MKAETATPHAVERVRHETRLRTCTVLDAWLLAPRMRRIVLGGPALDGFCSLGFDDHVKLHLPVTGTDGKPITRDYTPRHFDGARLELTIDMALHGDGPACRWAAQARVGETVGVGGPRVSSVVSETFDWWALVGDESALPAITRRLAEAPPGLRTMAWVQVDGAEDELPLATRANLQLQWLHRNRRESLLGAMNRLVLPPGSGYVWVACESTVAKAIRARLVDHAGADPRWLKAAAYWRRGSAAVHEVLMP